MKLLKFFILVLCLSFISVSYAQDNNIKPDEIAEKQLEDLDKDVNLDDFQKLELRDFMLDNTRKIQTAIKNGMDSSEIRFLIENNNRELDTKLKEVLTPEQYQKYIDSKRERALNKDNKKKKRKPKGEIK